MPQHAHQPDDEEEEFVFAGISIPDLSKTTVYAVVWEQTRDDLRLAGLWNVYALWQPADSARRLYATPHVWAERAGLSLDECEALTARLIERGLLTERRAVPWFQLQQWSWDTMAKITNELRQKAGLPQLDPVQRPLDM